MGVFTLTHHLHLHLSIFLLLSSSFIFLHASPLPNDPDSLTSIITVDVDTDILWTERGTGSLSFNATSPGLYAFTFHIPSSYLSPIDDRYDAWYLFIDHMHMMNDHPQCTHDWMAFYEGQDQTAPMAADWDPAWSCGTSDSWHWSSDISQDTWIYGPGDLFVATYSDVLYMLFYVTSVSTDANHMVGFTISWQQARNTLILLSPPPVMEALLDTPFAYNLDLSTFMVTTGFYISTFDVTLNWNTYDPDDNVTTSEYYDDTHPTWMNVEHDEWSDDYEHYLALMITGRPTQVRNYTFTLTISNPDTEQEMKIDVDMIVYPNLPPDSTSSVSCNIPSLNNPSVGIPPITCLLTARRAGEPYLVAENVWSLQIEDGEAHLADPRPILSSTYSSVRYSSLWSFNVDASTVNGGLVVISIDPIQKNVTLPIYGLPDSTTEIVCTSTIIRPGATVNCTLTPSSNNINVFIPYPMGNLLSAVQIKSKRVPCAQSSVTFVAGSSKHVMHTMSSPSSSRIKTHKTPLTSAQRRRMQIQMDKPAHVEIQPVPVSMHMHMESSSASAPIIMLTAAESNSNKYVNRFIRRQMTIFTESTPPPTAPPPPGTAGPTQGPTQGATQAPTQAPTQGATQAPTQVPTQGATQPPSPPTQGPTQGGPTQPSSPGASQAPPASPQVCTTYYAPSNDSIIGSIISTGSSSMGLVSNYTQVDGTSFSFSFTAGTGVGVYTLTVGLIDYSIYAVATPDETATWSCTEIMMVTSQGITCNIEARREGIPVVVSYEDISVNVSSIQGTTSLVASAASASKTMSYLYRPSDAFTGTAYLSLMVRGINISTIPISVYEPPTATSLSCNRTTVALGKKIRCHIIPYATNTSTTPMPTLISAITPLVISGGGSINITSYEAAPNATIINGVPTFVTGITFTYRAQISTSQRVTLSDGYSQKIIYVTEVPDASSTLICPPYITSNTISLCRIYLKRNGHPIYADASSLNVTFANISDVSTLAGINVSVPFITQDVVTLPYRLENGQDVLDDGEGKTVAPSPTVAMYQQALLNKVNDSVAQELMFSISSSLLTGTANVIITPSNPNAIWNRTVSSMITVIHDPDPTTTMDCSSSTGYVMASTPTYCWVHARYKNQRVVTLTNVFQLSAISILPLVNVAVQFVRLPAGEYCDATLGLPLPSYCSSPPSIPMFPTLGSHFQFGFIVPSPHQTIRIWDGISGAGGRIMTSISSVAAWSWSHPDLYYDSSYMLARDLYSEYDATSKQNMHMSNGGILTHQLHSISCAVFRCWAINQDGDPIVWGTITNDRDDDDGYYPAIPVYPRLAVNGLHSFASGTFTPLSHIANVYGNYQEPLKQWTYALTYDGRLMQYVYLDTSVIQRQIDTTITYQWISHPFIENIEDGGYTWNNTYTQLCSRCFFMLMSDIHGHVYSWGQQWTRPFLGRPADSMYTQPRAIAHVTGNITHLLAVSGWGMIVINNGTQVYTWGRQLRGTVLPSTNQPMPTTLLLRTPNGTEDTSPIVSIDGGTYMLAIVTRAGYLYLLSIDANARTPATFRVQTANGLDHRHLNHVSISNATIAVTDTTGAIWEWDPYLAQSSSLAAFLLSNVYYARVAACPQEGHLWCDYMDEDVSLGDGTGTLTSINWFQHYIWLGVLGSIQDASKPQMTSAPVKGITIQNIYLNGDQRFATYQAGLVVVTSSATPATLGVHEHTLQVAPPPAVGPGGPTTAAPTLKPTTTSTYTLTTCDLSPCASSLTQALQTYQLPGTIIQLSAGIHHITSIEINTPGLIIRGDPDVDIHNIIINCGGTRCFIIKSNAVAFRMEHITIINAQDHIQSHPLDGKGGAIAYIQSDVVFNDIIMQQAISSGNGGALSVQSNGFLQCTNCIIHDSTSQLNGGGISCGSNGACILNNMICYNNRAILSGGCIHADDTELTLMNSNIYDNTAYVGGGAIALSRGSNAAVIQDTIINNNYVNTTGTGGGAMLVSESSITLSHVTIDNNHAPSGGAIYLSFASLHIQQSDLTSNEAMGDGSGSAGSGVAGAIFCLGEKDLIITNTTFTSNVALNHGGSVFAVYCAPIIISSTFSSNTASQGAAIAIRQQAIVTVTDTLFHSNHAYQQGGAISLVDTHPTRRNIITHTTFYNNTVSYQREWSSITHLSTSSTDIDSEYQIFGYGGAMAIMGYAYADIITCNFTANRIWGAGAGVYWSVINPMIHTSHMYRDNMAIYGNNYASAATSLVWFNDSTQDAASAELLTSPLIIILRDWYNQMISTDYTSAVSLTANETEAYVLGDIAVTLISGMYAWEPNTSTTVGVLYKTNSHATLYAESNGLRTSNVIIRLRGCVPGEYGDGTRCVPVDVGKYTDIAGATSQKSCPAGSYADQPGSTACKKCPAGSYCPESATRPTPCSNGYFSESGVDFCTPCPNNAIPSDNRTSCLCATGYYGFPATGKNSTTATYAALKCVSCPAGAVCDTPGTMAATALAQPGWYPSITHNGDFIKCLNDACVGGEQQCAPGYTSHLCTACERGWGRTGKYNCEKCGNQGDALARIILICLAIIIAIGIFIWSTIRSSFSHTAMHSIIIKIVISCLQFNSIAASFHYDWPDVIARLLEAEGSTIDIGVAVLNVDCFLPHGSSSFFYWKTIILMCVPILGVVIPWVFYLPWLYWHRRGLGRRVNEALQRRSERIKAKRIARRSSQTGSISLASNSVISTLTTPATPAQTTSTVRIKSTQTNVHLGTTVALVPKGPLPDAAKHENHHEDAPITDDHQALHSSPAHVTKPLSPSSNVRHLVPPSPSHTTGRPLLPPIEEKSPSSIHRTSTYVLPPVTDPTSTAITRDIDTSETLPLSRLDLSSMKREYMARTDVWARLKNNYICTVVMMLFILHPTITHQVFQILTCKQLGSGSDTYYLLADLTQQCWTSSHYLWVYGIGLPALLVYVLGIPAFGLYLLRSNHVGESILRAATGSDYDRKHLDLSIRVRYSFLFNGYTHEYYFWELVVVCRKICLVCIAVFFSYDGQIQALLAVLLVVIALCLHIVARPFEHGIIDHIETFSLCTSFITFYCGQYLFVSQIGTSVRVVLTVVIAGANLAFFGFTIAFLVHALLNRKKHHAIKSKTHSLIDTLKRHSTLLSTIGNKHSSMDVGLENASPTTRTRAWSDADRDRDPRGSLSVAIPHDSEEQILVGRKQRPRARSSSESIAMDKFGNGSLPPRRGSLPLPRANMYSTISPSTPINTNTNTNPNPTFESGTPLSPPPALPVALTTPSLVPPTLPPLPSADSIDEGTVETDDMHLESVSTGTRSAEPQLQATSSSAS